MRISAPSRTPLTRTGRRARPQAVRCPALYGIACAAALAVLSAPPGRAADEMTEAEAIKEIERLGGEVREAAPPPDPARATPPPRTLIANVAEEYLREQLQLLRNITALGVLRIRAQRLDDDELAELKFCSRLHSLTVVLPAGVTIAERALNQIADIKSLTDVDLAAAGTPEGGFAHIAKLENLEQLRAAGSGITDAALTRIATLSRLKRLTLSRTAVTDAGVKELRRLASLEQLSIHSKDIGDGAIGGLSGLNLRELSIGDGITDTGLKDLSGFKTLRLLDLAGLPITDAGLKYIPQMAAPRSVLNLDRTMISDSGLDQLERLATLRLRGLDAAGRPRERSLVVPGLAELHIEDTRITDDGLSRFRKFENVPDLYLRGTNVSAEGMDKLQLEKNVRIRSWPGSTATSGAGASSGGNGRVPGPRR